MKRPNLASRPFLDVRPVWAASGALAFLALALTAVSVTELLQARGRERTASAALRDLQARRTELTVKVSAANRRLAAVGWKKLQLETSSLQDVVARQRLVWSDLLADLERVLPWDVRLVGINPRVVEGGAIEVELEGLATGRDAWLRLLAALFVDPRFSDPLPRSEEAPSATNSQGYKFSLSARYWPEGRP